MKILKWWKCRYHNFAVIDAKYWWFWVSNWSLKVVENVQIKWKQRTFTNVGNKWSKMVSKRPNVINKFILFCSLQRTSPCPLYICLSFSFNIWHACIFRNALSHGLLSNSFIKYLLSTYVTGMSDFRWLNTYNETEIGVNVEKNNYKLEHWNQDKVVWSANLTQLVDNQSYTGNMINSITLVVNNKNILMCQVTCVSPWALIAECSFSYEVSNRGQCPQCQQDLH